MKAKVRRQDKKGHWSGFMGFTTQQKEPLDVEIELDANGLEDYGLAVNIDIDQKFK